MRQLPQTENALVLRTDFSDDAAWEAVRAAVREPVGEYQAYVDCVSDAAFDGLTAEQLVELASEDEDRTFVFLVDRTTLTHPEHPVLVVDVGDDPGRTFRVIPRAMSSVENNLSLANMDFSEFAEAADADGIFRGFPEP